MTISFPDGWKRHAVSCLSAADRLVARWGVWALVAIALVYYASYFNRGLNLGGEGGTTAVIAMRLMEGQRPIADTFLGYNVLWFYPVAWLFEWTGPSYWALRAFFFGLCTATGLLGFLCVWRVSRSGLLAFGVGLVLILIPGMMFRNYMGLMAVGNQLVLTSAFLLPVQSTRRRMALLGLSGMVLGITYLIRIEVGLFLTVIWLGLIPVFLLGPGGRVFSRLKVVSAGVFAAVCLFAATHFPFVVDSFQRGYSKEFFGQYTAFLGLYEWEIRKELKALEEWWAAQRGGKPDPVSDRAAPSAGGSVTDPAAAGVGGVPGPAAEVSDGRRPRPPVSEIWMGERARDRYFAAAIYFPLIPVALLVLIGSVGALVAWWWRSDEGWIDSWTVLVLTGCALALFPQYFSFRPDTPHLSEFMVPFVVALAGGCALGWKWLGRVRAGSLRLVPALVLVLTVILQIGIHFGHAFPKESAGTAAARKHGPISFEGSNGVSVLLREKEAPGIQGLYEAVTQHSRPGEYVICLPYSPTINFMTNRPSYLYDLYTDNTMAGEEFDSFHIRLAKQYQPAVFVIDHREINNTPESSFPRWAPVFYSFLQANYDMVGNFLGNEVFVRRVPGQRDE